MTSSSIPILVVVSHNPQLDQFLEAEYASHPIDVKKFSDAEAFYAWVPGKKINGVLIDFPSAMKASLNTRQFLSTIENYLPVCRIRIDPKTSKVSGQILSEFFNGPELFNTLLQRVALPEAGRQIRQCPRLEKYWNVQLLDVPENQSRYVTKDFSAGGFFMVDTQNLFSIGQKFKVQILELGEATPIEVEVRWIQPWGKSKDRMPGIGVQFRQINDSQKNKLNQLLGLTVETTDLEMLVQALES